MTLIPSISSQVLALHSDGITTTGAVYRRAKGQPEEVARASVLYADPSAALTEIIQSLKADGAKVPKRVMLASDRVVLNRVELPVHPDRRRPYEQMREVVRWETEVAFSDLASWNIEGVLKAMGAVDELRDSRIHNELRDRNSAALGGAAQRYHDVALSMGIIDRATRDVAVEFHEALNQPVGDTGCGWVPTGSDKSDNFMQHHWLLTSISELERRAWREACTLNKLQLVGFLPSWGMSDFAARKSIGDSATGKSSRLLLERHSGAVSLLHINGDSVESVRLVNLNRPDVSEHETLHRILDGREQPQITAVGFSKDAQVVIRQSFPEPDLIEDTVSAVLTSVAARLLDIKQAPGWPPMIAPNEPSPPIWKNDNFYRAGLVACVLIGVASADDYARWNKHKLEMQMEQLEADYEERSAISKAITASVNAAKSLEGEIVRTKLDIADLRQREENAIYLQSHRQVVIEGLLEALRNSIPKGVMARDLVESGKTPEIFVLTGWALTDIDAERFIARLNDNLIPVGLAVASETVFEQTGPQKLKGYAIQLRIVPLHGGS